MASIDWRVVPIEEWPGEETEECKDHPFRYTPSGSSWSRSGVNWTATMELLERELRMLEAEDILLQMAVTDSQIRKDGWIYANARPEHPGVVLTFESKHGPLSYPCDTFDDWQANIRAIALALEALRKVDRYGVTKTGQQYTGWKKIGPGGSSSRTMGVEKAARVVADLAYRKGGGPHAYGAAERILEDPEELRARYREAAKGAHPDAPGGSVEDFQTLQAAKDVLDRHHGVRP